jgi:hypothetical protein
MQPSGPESPYWLNGYCSGLDAFALSGFIVSRRPRRIVEVGSGMSTLFARHAVRKSGLPTTIISIDPEPRAAIDAVCDQVIRTRLEECDPGLFSALEPGDILFFDGSHRVFTNNDTVALFLDIMPELPPGVLLHIHDIFWPADYPPAWNRRFYSEQYMLAVALLYGDRLTPLLSSAFASADAELRRKVEGLLDFGSNKAPFYYNGRHDLPAVSFWSVVS